MLIILHKFKRGTLDDPNEESELDAIEVIEGDSVSVPRTKDIVICNDITYRVTEVVYDYDLDKIWVRVKLFDSNIKQLIHTLYHKIQNGFYKAKL